MHGPLLAAHIAAGTLGLSTGLVAALVGALPGQRWRRLRWRSHTVLGWAYQGCCLVLCTSAVALVWQDAQLWPFLLLAIPTEIAAVGGVVVRRRRRPGWVPLHVQLLLGSYVSFVTALCVQLTDGALLGWFVPVAAGSSLVSVVTWRMTLRYPTATRPAPVVLAQRAGTAVGI